jgi:hypothetical protein
MRRGHVACAFGEATVEIIAVKNPPASNPVVCDLPFAICVRESSPEAEKADS